MGKKAKISSESQGISGSFNRLSQHKSFTFPFVQYDHLSFYQDAVSRSRGNFSEIREKPGKNERSKKWTSCQISAEYQNDKVDPRPLLSLDHVNIKTAIFEWYKVQLYGEI